MCLVLRPLGSSGDPRGKSKLSLFQQQALCQGCVTVSRCPVCSLPFQLQMLLPLGRSGNLHHEVCTAKTSAALLLPALPGAGQHVLSHKHREQPSSPQDRQVTLPREMTLLVFLSCADMIERGRVNCCFYWQKAINKGDGTIPWNNHIRNREGGGRNRTTGQKSCRETDSFAMHSPFKSSPVWKAEA